MASRSISFTYRLSDGPLESNLATVSLSITAVNDAPVVADVQASTAEDTSLPMNLLAQATDIEGGTLTAAIVAGAQHGQVSVNGMGALSAAL